MSERERYSLDAAIRRVRKPMDQIKDVMRFSDISSVSINKWNSTDRYGKVTTKFHTTIYSDLDEEEIYKDEEEE